MCNFHNKFGNQLDMMGSMQDSATGWRLVDFLSEHPLSNRRRTFFHQVIARHLATSLSSARNQVRSRGG